MSRLSNALFAVLRPQVECMVQPLVAPATVGLQADETLFETLCRLAETWAR